MDKEPIKKGDILECDDNTGLNRELTIRNEYVAQSDEYVFVSSDGKKAPVIDIELYPGTIVRLGLARFKFKSRKR